MTANSSGSGQAQTNQTDHDRQDQTIGFEDQVEQRQKASQDQQATDNSPPNMQADESNMARQESSNALTMDTLPQDVKEVLPEEAQRLFLAAYNSIMASNNDEQTAAQVAWQTIELNEHYQRGEDGKWRRLPDNAGMHTPIHETSP
ncbi:ChaB family protein [Thermocoleostomius sinensis]|uniref:ChaB family protein n=1 Tax=Thermocoleostomius sinensis A174 TaxID=2016057 RepID=A0A9E8Z9I1_9CYAN|nr:ChaB family protein [Thermocoleostomius sinensis]WAL58791.1 ChaB family protein [Thermocoleostomius sinensis A174]